MKILLASLALLLAFSSAYATDAQHGFYHNQSDHTLTVEEDGGYELDRALLCELIKKGKPNSNDVRELTFRCQGHPYPHVKPIFSISKEKWYATTIDGRLFLSIVSDGGKSIEIWQYGAATCNSDGLHPELKDCGKD